MFDTTKSLEQLDGHAWGEPEIDTYLVRTVHRLRRKPLKDFEVEDLRIMIGQQVGLEYLIPLAIKVLAENPLAEGDYYPGDLFWSVLKPAPDFWNSNPDLKKQMDAIIVSARPALGQLDESLRKYIEDRINAFSGDARDQSASGTRE